MGFFGFGKKKKKDDNAENDGDINGAKEEPQANEEETKEEEPFMLQVVLEHGPQDNEKEEETRKEDEPSENKTNKNSNKKEEEKEEEDPKENGSIPGEVNFVEMEHKVFKITNTFETASTHSLSIDYDQMAVDAMTKQRADSPHYRVTQQLSELFMVEMQKSSVEDVTRALCVLASLFLHSSSAATKTEGFDPEDYAKEALILGGHTVVFLGMKRYPHHEQLQRAGCSCILLLAKHIRNTIVAAGGMEIVVEALRLHPESKLVQRSACAALSSCYHKFQKAPLSVAKKLHRFVSDQEGLQLVVTAMNRFPLEADLQDIGCRFLCNLSKSHVFCDVLRKTKAMSAVTRANEKHPQNEAILLCAQKLTAAVLA